jgi:hypothetical protein
MLIKIKIFRFYLAFHIRNYFRVNYKNFDFSVDGYGTSGAKVYNGKKAQRFSGENIEESVATDFWTVNNTSFKSSSIQSSSSGLNLLFRI